MSETSGQESTQGRADEFLLYLDAVRGLSAATVTAYKNALARFVGFTRGKALRDICAEDIRDCIARLSRQNLSAATINQFIAAVRTFFAYCRKFQYIEKNVASEIKTVKMPRRIPRFLTGPEVDALCAEPDEKELLWAARDKAILEMLYSSGCRISELCSIRVDDMDEDFSSALVTGKGGKDRRVYFERDAREAFKAYMGERAALFKKKRKQDDVPQIFVSERLRPLTSAGARWIISRYSGQEGMNHHVSPHALRHTFATAMLAGGADVRVVQELLGHASISTTQRYTHITTERLIDTYNKAHPHGGNHGG